MRLLLLTGLVLTVCRSSEAQLNSTAVGNNSVPTYSAVPQLPRNSSSVLEPLFQPHSNNTPVFKNEAIIKHLTENPGARLDHLDLASLKKRQDNGLPVGTCAPGIPCSNGACCSDTGVCSYAPTSCGADVCISNCDAKAPCGQYAVPETASCPLNVCCSKHGFCGSTDDFCGDGCQEGFGGCGPPPTPQCSGSSAMARRIGYYESWATTRPCDVVQPEDLQLTGMTHLNFAFSFFDPTTFQITPMDANAASLLSRFTALKSKQPGLQVWLSVGGWSFNDATNTPNTQNAFSDMAGSAANRRAFINSLLNFMQTYGFDGVDLDWEYPVADDRGGKPADFANFPTFLSELRASFGSALGISATLPSSYWYLQHFDLLSMEPHLDWLNLMSYDIHGVWDSTNKFTGPYIRPHTNLTEIEDGLSLLWRAGVSPSKVVLGLGWYGRSFTLTDPACNIPNGVCQFSSGGTAGECSRSSGTLTNAEIKRIQASGGVVESYDAEAAVKWMTWDSNQWISYDDGVTMQQKMERANSLCLGGIMIWALDQDNKAGDSMSDLLGIGPANGISTEAAQSYKEQLANATLQQAIASSCYWSLCGEGCHTGYFGTTEARGQVAGVQKNSICALGETQTLCCAPGTTMGTCKWEGFRGIGFPCSPACSDAKATIVARNSNSYQDNEGGQLADLTCTGGYQAYCCTGFVPSSITNAGNLVLYGQNGDEVSKRDLITGELALIQERGLVLQERGAPLLLGGLGALCLEAATPLLALAPFTFGLSAAIEGAICAAAALAALAVGFAIISSIAGWLFGSSPSQPNTGVPTTIAGRASYGQWPILDFGGAATSTSCDCSVTYTCRYGMGWDEVCDNQRWAINKKLGGQTVFHPFSSGGGVNRAYSGWASTATQRHAAYRTLVQGSNRPDPARCQLDEFPMANLRESGNGAPQACRLVNKQANGAQGRDYLAWKRAQWVPCFRYRRDVCRIQDNGPPATWKFNQLSGGRGPGSGKRFIDAFGFDLQTPGSLCFASYTYTRVAGAIENTMITDHGFRVLDDDPMYDRAYGWPRQSYRTDPAPINGPRPYNLQPGIFQRDLAVSSNTTENATDNMVCHVNLGDGQGSNSVDAELDYDNLLFLDGDGNQVDGRTCGVIYDDRDEEQLHIVVDADGNVVDMYTDDEAIADAWSSADPVADSSIVTVTAETATVTAAAQPGNGEPTLPISTMVTATRMGSVMTLAPS
ncbi:hypothetical protein BDP55DRAFT_213442 [Colletotrichum godetiae]|uniref:chitinase n=1 Tax=Colletotrichum godetiae TaxID=1209918 RepID=A0AAJ0AXB3_9PEZI|nr:uncharacterized protein BDP55DRAFT_213442 [Colletotrichum godetiae]KAK1699992.1 hypothetical protein BDP55DRAFT_213442 [Colletotrichum godetiae]